MHHQHTRIQETTVSPQAREAAKSPRRKREDIAYTVNHTIVCGTKDMLEPFFTNWLQTHFGRKDQGEAVSLRGNLREWLIGEAAGDIGAVPVTIAVQRLAPGMMEGIGNRLESAFGGHFLEGAQKAARHWALEHKVPLDDPQVHERAQRIYRYEMDHLPQAAIWTVSSIGMNIGTQKLLPIITHGRLENPESIGKLFLFKTIGAAVAAGALFTARSLSPRQAHKWDRWMAENIFSPAEKLVDNMLGIHTPQQAEGRWGTRISHAEPASSKGHGI